MLTLLGTPCDVDGHDLQPCTTSHQPSSTTISTPDWGPYQNQIGFELADFLYRTNEMSQKQIDRLMELWTAAAREKDPEAQPPFTNHQDLLHTIDSSASENARWQSFSLNYKCPPIEHDDAPSWKLAEYEVWFRDARTMVADILKNKSFMGELDCSPYKEYDSNGKRRYKDMMSGDWAWNQAVSQLSLYVKSSTTEAF